MAGSIDDGVSLRWRDASPTGFWRRAAYCEHNACVEVSVSFAQGMVAVRDSKDDASPILAFDRREWSDFISGIQTGQIREK
ncbi:DUF397 domain-containing protein [Micromonospora sp. CPCC 205371]|nr:DUF397 domain-containing protein [Micromonospora sp. CPCC 205371]